MFHICSVWLNYNGRAGYSWTARSNRCRFQHSLTWCLSVCLWVALRRKLESSRNVMAHGDAREGKWRGNWRMQWVASTLHTTSEHGVSSITTADAHTSAASSRLNWRLRRFKWTRPFRRKKKSGFCACAITFQLAFTTEVRTASEYGVLRCLLNV